MATTYKVLGQVNPSATTETDLYTVGSGKSAIVSTITVCNQASSTATYRIVIRPSADASTAAKHYIAYDTSVGANNTTALTLGITLAASDKIRVYGSSSTISFSAFGSEIA